MNYYTLNARNMKPHMNMCGPTFFFTERQKMVGPDQTCCPPHTLARGRTCTKDKRRYRENSFGDARARGPAVPREPKISARPHSSPATVARWTRPQGPPPSQPRQFPHAPGTGDTAFQRCSSTPRRRNYRSHIRGWQAPHYSSCSHPWSGHLCPLERWRPALPRPLRQGSLDSA